MKEPSSTVSPFTSVAGGDGAVRAMHVLIAEPCPREQLRLLVALSRLGHTVQFAEDGLELMQALSEGRADLLLVDWELPVLDAESALARIRQGMAGELALRVPVVVLVAGNDPTVVPRAEKAGARSVLTKPIQAEAVVRLMSSLAQGAA